MYNIFKEVKNMAEKLYDEYELPVDRRKRIISDLDSIDDGYYDDGMSSQTIITSSIKKKKQEKDEEELADATAWFTTLSELSQTKIKVSKHANNIWKKDKKKKKKKDEPTDYAHEFEPESELINNLMIAQSRFVDSLQERYDNMMSSKASAKGNSKFLTDFIEQLNDARQSLGTFVKQKSDLKKTIAELNMKERKEFSNTDLLGDDLNNFAATYLKNIIAKESGVGYTGVSSIEDADTEDDIFSFLDMNDDMRSEDAKSYLKYENRNVRIEAVVNPNDFDDYEFIAYADNGDILTDYPLPDKTHLSLNRSTMIATDNYGQKFKFEWREDL